MSKTLGESVDAVEKIMHAGSLAVVGASIKENTIRGRALSFPKRFGFSGVDQLIAVNPSYDEVQGIKCVSSVLEIKGQPDVALICVPADSVSNVLKDCGAIGIKQAIIFTSGFGEQDERGIRKQLSLAEIAQEVGIRILGPNCIGAINLADNKALSFASSLDEMEIPLQTSPTALITQSGAMGNLLLSSAKNAGVGFHYMVSTGNELDLTWSDVGSWVARQDGITTVTGYIESIRDGEAFEDTLRELAEQGKRVIILKAGRTPEGARGTVAHTGRLAGDDKVFDAVCSEYGVKRVYDMKSLLIAAATARTRESRGIRVGLITASGGMAAVLADQSRDFGLTVETFSEELLAELSEVIPEFGSAQNPVDVTGAVVNAPEMRQKVASILLRSGEIDSLGLFLGANANLENRSLSETLELVEASLIPVVSCWIGGTGEFVRGANSSGHAAFADATDTLQALAMLIATRTKNHGRKLRADACHASTAEVAEAIRMGKDDLEIIAKTGIPVVNRSLIDRDQLATFKNNNDGKMYYLKIHGKEYPHKSDINGVDGPIESVNIASQLREFAKRFPLVEAFEIQEAIFGSRELVVAVKRDATFGWVGILGLGGIMAEVVDEVVIILPPFTSTRIAEWINSTDRLSKLLNNFRGLGSVQIGQIAEIMGKMLAIGSAMNVNVIEINPFVIDDHTGNGVAVDALVE